MKVAIIGAGVAGLSCAHELERYGISPIIFEDTNFIGDKESHITAILSVVDRPIHDALSYFHNVCHLDLTPINVVKRLTHYSPNKKVVIEGENFGYFFERGKNRQSLKCQLKEQLKTTIIQFSEMPDYVKLSKEYDYVVIATGNPENSKRLGCWQPTISGWVKGATFEGDFDPNELIMYLNKKYCKSGYAYACPYDSKRISISLFVPFITRNQLDYYWELFLKTEKINFKLVEDFMIEHFCGFATPHKVDNIYLVGSCGGGLSPFLGFGQLNCISMGVFSAMSIAEGLDYEKLIKPIVDKENSFYEIRKAFDNMTNSGYDKLVTLIGLPGIKHLIYFTNLNVIKYSGLALSIKNKIFKSK